MLKTSMRVQEESRIFDELLSRFDVLSEEQMQAVGVARESSAKDVLGHLTHWEQGAAEQVRELQSGTWSPRKKTLEEVERTNRGVRAANRAMLVPQLREQFSRARTEIVSALRDAPEEMDETYPLARIVRSQCVPHKRSPSGATRCLGRAFAKWVIVRKEFGPDRLVAERRRGR